MKRYIRNPWLKVVLALLLLIVTTGSAGAITYDLTAEAGTLTMPDGAVVPIWGYRLTSDPVGSAKAPGPVIDVPAGDSTLIVNLTNNLPTGEATSLHILGQTMTAPGAPTYNGGRVMSFVKETAAGATVAYQWDNFKPGTYLLQSATHPARQVQMGLYAAVKANSGANQAYPGLTYDAERVLVFHEIDPDFHNAPDTTAIVHRHPRYFLINGAAYPNTSLAEVGAGQTVLLRFVNAGLETHVPQILNKYLTLVAQDGQPKLYSQEVYGFELNAAATMDALLQTEAADNGSSFPIYDGRVKHLTSAGSTFGGMLVKLNVGAGGPPAGAVTILRARFNAPTSELRVWATSSDPAATLTVDGFAAASITSANFTDPNVLTGAYTRLYVSGVAANPGTVTVSSSSGGSATVAVPSTMDPQAVPDAYAVDQGLVLNVAAAGLLTNDLKGGWLVADNALRAVLGTQAANGTAVVNLDGSISYTPNTGFSGQDSFTYVAQAYNTANNNLLAASAPAAVTIYVNAANGAPVAQSDTYNGTQGVTLNVPAPGVLGNDTDAEGSPLTAVLDTGPSAGTLTLGADGSFTFNGPAGSHSFTYVANDGAVDSAPATVTLNINDLPVAVGDSYATDENVTLNVAAPGVLGNDTDANPAGGALTASQVSGTTQGILTLNPNGSFTYAPGFNFAGADSFTYQVTDALGAMSAPVTVNLTVNNVGDTVTITRLRWRNNNTAVRILATSSAPAGSAVLSAFANFSTGTPQALGTLTYNAAAAEYRATKSFNTARGLPVSITVTSNQGGSDTRPIPYN